MKKYLLLIALLASAFSFSACSDDDEDIDVKQLEGTWISIHDEGFFYEEGKLIDWNDDYDPANPTNDCEKRVITKIDDNIYSVITYFYHNDKWEKDSDAEKFKLDGSNIIPADGSTISGYMKIITVNSEQLVIESKGTDEDGDNYNKTIYKRM